MRSILVIILLCIGLGANSQNQKVLIKGMVTDNKSKLVLQGVHVLYGLDKGTITNSKGYFIFSIDPGQHEIAFQSLGYQTQTKNINAIAGDSLELNIVLYETISELEAIVFSANKIEHKLAESTVSIQILKPELIQRNHITNAEEIINQTPGIDILDGQASIRGGSGYSYGAGSRVLVLIDGLPMLSADAGDVKWHFLPLENLSQLEIIKGASSVLYGSSALNGIINFRTAETREDPVTKFSMLAGVYDRPKQKNWVWTKSPRMFSNASFFHSQKKGNNDIGIGSSFFFDQGYRSLNDNTFGRINIKLKHYSKRFSSLSYGLNVNSMYVEKRDFLIWENAESGALRQNESTAMQLKGILFTADPYISINKNNRLKHDLKVRFQTTRNKLVDNEQNNSTALSYYAEYKFWYSILNNLNITTGISQYYKQINSNFYKDHKGLNIAGYLQFNYRPIERLKIITGIRFEQNSLDGISDRLRPVFRTGFNYQAADYTFLRLSWGQGYRYPSVAERHAYTTVGSIKIFPNSEIKPEQGWSTEIGIKQGLNIGGWKGQIDLSIFYSQNKDLIEYVFGLYPNPVTMIHDYAFMASNIENSRVSGAEIELITIKEFNNLKLDIRGGYTFMYPVEFNSITGKSTDIYLKYRNKHSAKVFINCNYKKFGAGINFMYNSKMLNIDDAFVNPFSRETILPGFYDYWLNNNDGYLVTDMHFARNFANNSSLSISVKNLFNSEYMGRPGDIMPQRNFSIQYNRRF